MLLNRIAPDILAQLGWAAVGGGIVALLIGGLCRMFRFPPRWRTWLWWLVAARFLCGLLPVVSWNIELPHSSAAAPLLRPLTALASVPSPAETHRNPPAEPKTTSRIPSETQEMPLPPLTPAAASTLSPVSLVLLLYLAGGACFLGRALREMHTLRRLIVQAQRIDDPETVALLKTCLHEVGGTRLPDFRESAVSPAPFVAGCFRPVLVLPTGFAENVPPASLRLALLHELLHLRRGDLWAGWIPWAARLVFWWFPLAPIAAREWEQAREEACDAAVVALGRTPALTYGKLLVQLATGEKRASVTMANLAAPGLSPLKRRLTALRQGTPRLSRGQRVVLSLSFVLLLVGTLPYRLHATLPTEAAPALFGVSLPRYEIIPLGTLGGEYGDAYAINETGTVAGAASLDDKQGRGHAFLADTRGQLIDLSADSDFPRSLAQGVNAEGAAAATAFYRSGKPQAFYWDGKRHYIGTLPGFGYGQAVGVNDRGTVAGTALKFRRQWGALPARAWVWQKGSIRDLGTLGGNFSHSTAINNAGQVVGKSDGEDGATHAFVWDTVAGMRDLGTLPGGRNSRAQAISDVGEIVGVSETTNGARQAFVLTPGDTMRPLPLPPDGRETVAQGINANGRIVGSATDDRGETRAVLWMRNVGESDGRVVDLNSRIAPDSGWRLLTARAINARGEIVGQGEWNGKRRAFLLRPLMESEGP